MDAAAAACIDERESYLILFTEGLNGYVCRNEGSASEARSLFRGSYQDCQVWVERRGLEAALRVVRSWLGDVGGLPTEELTGMDLLERLISPGTLG